MNLDIKHILQPTKQELNESIKALQDYRDRLRSEIINVSQKLRMPKVKIESKLDGNTELKNIENALKKLLSDEKEAI